MSVSHVSSADGAHRSTFHPPRQLSLLVYNMVILLISCLVTNIVRKCFHWVFCRHINRFRKMRSDLHAHGVNFPQVFQGKYFFLSLKQSVLWRSLSGVDSIFIVFIYIFFGISRDSAWHWRQQWEWGKVPEGSRWREAADVSGDSQQVCHFCVMGSYRTEEMEVFCNWVGCHGNRRWNTKITQTLEATSWFSNTLLRIWRRSKQRGMNIFFVLCLEFSAFIMRKLKLNHSPQLFRQILHFYVIWSILTLFLFPQMLLKKR